MWWVIFVNVLWVFTAVPWKVIPALVQEIFKVSKSGAACGAGEWFKHSREEVSTVSLYAAVLLCEFIYLVLADCKWMLT